MSAILVTMLFIGLSLPRDEIARQAQADFEKGIAAREDGDPSQKHFRAAAAGFEELRSQGVSNPALERNLGNAYLLCADLPRAILAYRRGLRLAPTDRRLRASLTEARGHVIFLEGSTLGRAPEARHPAWLPHMPRTLFATAAVGYSLFCFALARWFLLRRRRALMLAFAALLLAGGASLLLFVTHRANPAGAIVVIAENGVELRRGNGTAFPPRYDVPLNRGVEARLLHRLDGWFQIELSGGEVGWVAEGEVVVEE